MLSALIACNVCVGDRPGPLVDGAAAGVLVLLGVVAFVLLSIAGVALFWIQRARTLEANEEFEAKPAMRLFER